MKYETGKLPLVKYLRSILDNACYEFKMNPKLEAHKDNLESAMWWYRQAVWHAEGASAKREHIVVSAVTLADFHRYISSIGAYDYHASALDKGESVY